MDEWCDWSSENLAAERKIREKNGQDVAAAAPSMLSEKKQSIAGVPVLRCVPKDCVHTKPHLFIHGGGWVFGSSIQSLGFIRRVADQSKREIISIDYSLSPENKFPIAINEVGRVIRELAKYDGIAGIISCSAGAQISHHAMVQCSKNNIDGAISFYGAFSQSVDNWSHQKYGENNIGLNSTTMLQFINAYYAPKDNSDIDLSLLPPLFLSVGSNDPLLADTLNLHALLPKENDGVLEVIPGVGHGYINEWHQDQRINQAITDAVYWLEEVCRQNS